MTDRKSKVKVYLLVDGRQVNGMADADDVRAKIDRLQHEWVDVVEGGGVTHVRADKIAWYSLLDEAAE